MRKNSLLQKLLYGVMAVLGAYIMYKSGALLAARNQMQKTAETGSVQQAVEDSAMRTWSLGYTATVEGKGISGWLAAWFQQVVPALSYVAEKDDGMCETEALSGGSEEWTAEKESAGTEEGIKEPGAGEKTVAQDGSETGEKTVEQDEPGTGEETVEQDEPGTGEETVKQDDPETGEKTLARDEPGTESEAVAQTEPETETETITGGGTVQEVSVGTIFSQALPLLTDFSYLLSNYYTVDEDTVADAELINAEKLLSIDLSIEQDSSVPQILIYHTHSQEAFADSVEGEVSDTVVGMGEVLADELRSYGYNVIHDTGVYDLVDGVLDRSAAYDYAREAVEAILEEYPTIEVIIDLHRDGVEGDEEDFVTEVDGETTSKIMFFNGLSRNENGEALTWLPNGCLTENLAFSLQMQVLANAEYPGFTRKIYLQAERYNLHLRARSLLIEAGTQLNTVEEEKNAMAPIANLLRQILN